MGLVLVLIVAGGVTLAVLQPWSDDTTAGGGGGGGGEEPAAEAISGDRDGDGNGDVTLALIDDIDEVVQVVAGTSSGEGFEVAESAGDPFSAPNTITLDWDGDGAEEDLVHAYRPDPGELTLQSSDPDFPDTAPIPLEFSSLAEYYEADAEVVPGDFDGDGSVDLAVYGSADRAVDVHVMLGAGDGTFAAPQRWASLPNTLVSTTFLQAGDFDGDGVDDLFAEVPAEKLKAEDYDNGYFFGDEGFAELRSDGSSFEVGKVVQNEDYVTDFLVADVGRDKDLVLSLLSDSYEEQLSIQANEFLDGRLLPDPALRLTDPIGDRDLLAATASDVDGDGDEDLVYVVKGSGKKKVGDLTVVAAGPEGFTAGKSWGAVPACGYEYCSARFY